MRKADSVFNMGKKIDRRKLSRLDEVVQLTKRDKESIDVIKQKLIDSVGLTEDEASYYVGFYAALKKLGLLESNRLKNYDTLNYSFKDNKIPASIRNTFKSPQSYVNKPKLFYEILLTLLNNNKLLNEFEIAIKEDEEDSIELVPSNEVENKKVINDALLSSTKWDHLKVGEDENWITFLLDKWADTASGGSEIKTFYMTSWKDADDPLIEEFKKARGAENVESYFTTNWCNLAGQYAFTNQRHSSSNKWLVTFSKHNPAKIVLDNIKRIHPKGENATFSDLVSMDPLDRQKIRDQLGEIYLLSPDAPESDGHGNIGFHSFSNRPYHGVKHTKLITPPTYAYTALEINSGAEEFKKDGVSLERYNGNEEFVVLPQGIRIIESEAFKDKTKLRELVLPYTLQYIDENAFINCPNLTIIRAYNGLRHIHMDAFENAGLKGKIKFGVFIDGNEYIVKKPKALEMFPEDVFDVPSKPLTERLRTRRENFEEDEFIRRPLDYRDENIYVFNSRLKFLKDANVGSDFDIPEGITALIGEFPNNIVSLRLPSSFTELKQGQFEETKLRNVYLKDTNIKLLPMNCFRMSAVRSVELPAKLEILAEGSLASCRALSSLIIPAKVRIIDKKAFTGSGFLETLYTKDVEKLNKVLDDNVKKYIDIEFSESAY